jgi:hypothetical protein
MRSQAELLQALQYVRERTQSYLVPEWASWSPSLNTMLKLLDEVEARLNTGALAGEPYSDIRIGLYAVRNLEELDEGKLSLDICKLDNTLKNRGPEAVAP